MTQAYKDLADAEVEFLLARGWTAVEGGWREPDGRRDRVLGRSHAVNSERLRASERTGDEADSELVQEEIYYLEASGYERIGGQAGVGWRAPSPSKRTFFWREKAVHSQKAYDELDMKFTPRDHCTRCREHYDNCACDNGAP